MPSPFDEILKDAPTLPEAPPVQLPDRAQIGMDVLAKGGAEPEQRFQRSALMPRAGRPVRTQFENDLFTFDAAEITGDISKFDDGEEDPAGEEIEVCGETEQPLTYPVAIAHGHCRVNSSTVESTNVWKYFCQRVVPPLSGVPGPGAFYISDASLDQACDPTSFDAWNTNEFDNDGSGVEGPGMNIDEQSYLDCNLEMKPLQQGVYPYTRYKLSDGTFVHWIYGANDHSPQ